MKTFRVPCFTPGPHYSRIFRLFLDNHPYDIVEFHCCFFDRERMLEITCNDRLGKKVRVKCNPDDTIGDLKKLIAAQTGTHWEKIVLKKWYTIFKDHIKLQDYEIHDGMNLELYYQ